MAHNTTVFRQLLDLLPRHEFDAEARQHQEGQRLRVMTRWAQFVALGLGQLGGLQSLRDIVGNLRAQPHKLYHLGVRAFVSRSSLARLYAVDAAGVRGVQSSASNSRRKAAAARCKPVSVNITDLALLTGSEITTPRERYVTLPWKIGGDWHTYCLQRWMG